MGNTDIFEFVKYHCKNFFRQNGLTAEVCSESLNIYKETSECRQPLIKICMNNYSNPPVCVAALFSGNKMIKTIPFLLASIDPKDYPKYIDMFWQEIEFFERATKKMMQKNS